MPVQREEVAQVLRDRIMSGEYKPGDKVPSVRALNREFGAARDTGAAAVRLLAEEGLVSVRDKRSAVVLPPDERQTPNEGVADAKAELLALRDDVVALRQRLDDMAQRVTSALSKLRR
ncbi:GntR family transcriptional regulator [Actinophytocola sp.]|uniref:winged helix-turn-helix domain-containing protein n=1 Tax=Actinophytocola sp. TaxID=1872138 RepID=UPI0025C1A3D5|nr:GntR family transcriptional regulator [Actinophytocola sp.]